MKRTHDSLSTLRCSSKHEGGVAPRSASRRIHGVTAPHRHLSRLSPAHLPLEFLRLNHTRARAMGLSNFVAKASSAVGGGQGAASPSSSSKTASASGTPMQPGAEDKIPDGASADDSSSSTMSPGTVSPLSLSCAPSLVLDPPPTRRPATLRHRLSSPQEALTAAAVALQGCSRSLRCPARTLAPRCAFGREGDQAGPTRSAHGARGPLSSRAQRSSHELLNTTDTSSSLSRNQRRSFPPLTQLLTPPFARLGMQCSSRSSASSARAWTSLGSLSLCESLLSQLGTVH